VVVRWHKRIWRCAEQACPVSTFSEVHEFATARAKLTGRAVAWATDALRYDDTTVSAIARHLGVPSSRTRVRVSQDCHTAWNAIKTEAAKRVAKPERVKGVRTLGWTSTSGGPDLSGKERAVRVMVDLSRD
jgi:hypothetical protein